MTFGNDIRRFRGKVTRREIVVKQRLGVSAFQILVEGSPVKSGWFRASHRIGLGEVDTSVAPEPDSPSEFTAGDPMSSDEKAYAEAALGNLLYGQDVALSNSLPYAAKLAEDGFEAFQAAAQALLGQVGNAIATARRAVP